MLGWRRSSVRLFIQLPYQKSLWELAYADAIRSRLYGEDGKSDLRFSAESVVLYRLKQFTTRVIANAVCAASVPRLCFFPRQRVFA